MQPLRKDGAKYSVFVTLTASDVHTVLHFFLIPPVPVIVLVTNLTAFVAPWAVVELGVFAVLGLS